MALSESTQQKMHEMMEHIVEKMAENPKKRNQTDQFLASRFEEVKRLLEMAEMRMSFLNESGGEENPRIPKIGMLYRGSVFLLLLNLNRIITIIILLINNLIL